MEMAMVGYMKSTRHAAKDRRIMERLRVHAELTKKYQAEGLSLEEAMNRAMAEVLLQIK